MILRFLPAALLASAASGSEPQLCPLRDDDASCTRVLACVGDQGRWFHGRSLGRGAGDVVGVMSDGVACTGRWTERGVMGFGQADVTCDDGTRVEVIFTYQDRYSGTATGRGLTEDGLAVQVWSGQNVLGYLHQTTGAPTGTLPCAGAPMLLS
ncbi:MAG: hypothetical protein Q4G22_15085 [Paracoccus sp. (in: a-proteobacteria)]|uniref:hypothetical protein n=1 Tax=Paracoccus sp. TaxID=267 RepID=UPI0026DFFA9F|nr:hypothetical protein [Paracoccus sp. (in: a-proteobacteria)]MDO5633138.1 hypothetical protein [Paracoccus sp. (in: a-proteobacteria)]